MKNINTKNNIKKKAVTLSELLFLIVVICSFISIAAAGSSEKNKVTEPVLAPENPDFVKYQTGKKYAPTAPSLKEHKTGFIPSPVDLSHLSPISTVKKSAPAYYDLRTMNRVTSVKDQGDAGVCWAFTVYGSLESYLMPGENRDFSENNMKNLLSYAYPEGFDRNPNDGGNALMATAYLSRGSGPVDETDDPYNIYSGVSPQNLPIQKHIRDVLFIPDRMSSLDNNEIKSAVMKYGALHTTMFCQDEDPYYSSTNYSYYYKGSSMSNHGVCIVGWDDNFDRNNFSKVPPGNGAFIVKNSWGTDWGDNGYFYVSYYDSNIGIYNMVFIAEATDNYKNIYQYDPLGCTGLFGYEIPTAWCANIFTAKSDETLKAVSFYTVDSNCNYEVYIYTNPEPNNPISREGPVLSKSGTIPIAGYHTVPLGSEVQLKAGQKFSVVLKLKTPNFGYPIALELPTDLSSKATANLQESFISDDGRTWYDIAKYLSGTNVCIKAFTTNSGSVLPVFPGYTNPPTDLNQDGLYEDVNGNGILDFDDIVAYYENMGWIGENLSISFFDYNKNGLIDFDDVVKLYSML
ncbi:MAG: lectin like domain-containing protein [Methanosarcina sp.]|nr:lectin like domain-containing protein [Methanosarcina sp.]